MTAMISERAKNIVPSATIGLSARVEELAAQGVDVIKLNIGEPDFPPPENVCAAAAAAVEARFSKYTAVPGIVELRRAICDKLERDNRVRYAPSEICVSTGAKQALQNALLALCNPGDEVILPTPGWVSYSEMIKLAGAVPVFVPCRPETGFALEPEAVRGALTPRTRAVLICTPQNPTGAVYGEDALRNLAALACERDFYIIADEIYEKLIYDGARHFSVASVSEEVRRRTVTINGFSKAFAMPGWRLGYSAAVGDTAKAIADIQGHMTSAPNSIAQKAALAGLTGPQDALETMRAEYRRRRDFAFEALCTMPGVELVKPRGAFYLFPKVTAFYGARCGKHRVDSSRDLADYLLEEAKIAVVFGEAFFAPGYLRLSYAASMSQLREALRRMADALARLRR